MQFAEILAFTTFAWIASFTPGPNVAIAATTGVNHGLRAALPQVAGVPIGFVALMWLVGLGGMAILQASPLLVWGMKLAGNAYLLYLAWKLCFSRQLSSSEAIKPLSLMQAALFQIVNPKAWMMLVAATSTYAIGHADFMARMSWMSLGFIVPSALSVMAWAWMGQSLRSWLLVGNRLRNFNLCMGLALALTAVWMLTR
ncbi:LysE family translocator [Undibacterium sp. Rencai35W]|uniref:LysE family translocator n=1 Tax=Undibacterium sp. Rencai35W TaxID=3413046 RepID=UPI003BF157F0